MAIKIVKTCPLGSDCEKVVGDEIHRCRWYIQLAGKDPTSEKQIDEWGCAIEWMPILMVENSMQQRSTSAAVESFRNEMVDAQKASLEVLAVAAHLNNVPKIGN